MQFLSNLPNSSLGHIKKDSFRFSRNPAAAAAPLQIFNAD